MQLQLAPGLEVVRRGPHHLQVGLYADRRVVLPRTELTERVLAALEEGLPVDLGDAAVASTVERLVAAGCATARRDVLDRTRRRRTARVCLLGDDLFAGHRLGPASVVSEPSDADVALVGSFGEVSREVTDPLVRDGIAHLVVRLVDGGAVVGPFVLPGETACLRCIDAHVRRDDPDHLPVLARYVAASRQRRPGSGTTPTEPVLVALAVAWAARDLLAHVDGERPTTCDATVRLGPEPSRQVHTAWPRDPECGCSWPGSLAHSGKMVG